MKLESLQKKLDNLDGKLENFDGLPSWDICGLRTRLSILLFCSYSFSLLSFAPFILIHRVTEKRAEGRLL